MRYDIMNDGKVIHVILTVFSTWTYYRGHKINVHKNNYRLLIFSRAHVPSVPVVLSPMYMSALNEATCLICLLELREISHLILLANRISVKIKVM